MRSSARPAPLDAAPRRRYLTLLFSDLSDSTGIANLLEAEIYYDLLCAVRETYHRVIAQHHGAVAQISGDGMLAVFGHVETREGDSRRAVDAALELRTAIRALGGAFQGQPLSVHTGIVSGQVLMRAGDDIRGRFDLPGMATNVAARLCNAAGPDEILVRKGALGPERHLFEFTEHEVRVRGLDRPLKALRIVRRLALRGRYAASVRGGLTPFIGRAAELQVLENGLRVAMAGTVAVLTLRGAAGVGKTRLADQFVSEARSRGHQILRSECDADGAPLAPFIQIADRARGENSAALETADPSVSLPTRIIAQMLDAARRAPTILFIDDWQFADDASRSLLAALESHDCPLFVLLTMRTPAEAALPAPSAVGALEIVPFGETETTKAVQCLFPAADPFAVKAVLESSGGNPLFIEELCHSLASAHDIGVPAPASPWLDTLIEARFSRLVAEQARLLRTAAVIGIAAPVEMLATIGGFAASDPVFAELAEQDFLFPDERPGFVRFKHGITRDVIYGAIGLHERRALHLQIAETLRLGDDDPGDTPVEALAYHYGGAAKDAEAADYAEKAGDKAMQVSALDRAQSHYRDALAALERLPASDEVALRWSRIAQRFGRAGVFDPSRDQLAIFERAIVRAEARQDAAARAWAHYWLGYINYGLGEPMAAAKHCRLALEAALAVGDERFAVQIRSTLGQAHASACDYPAALALLDASIAAQKARHGDRPSASLGYSLSVRAFALGDMGRFDEAHAGFDDAMAAVRGAAREVAVSVLNQHAVTCLWQGELERAELLAGEGARVAEHVHSRYSHAMSRSIAAFSRWSLDGDPASVATLVAATAWLDTAERGQYTSLNHAWLATIMAAEGRVAHARHHAARALLRARKGDRLGESMALRAIARIAAVGGNQRFATAYLDRAMRAAEARGSAHEATAVSACRDELALQESDRVVVIAEYRLTQTQVEAPPGRLAAPLFQPSVPPAVA